MDERIQAAERAGDWRAVVAGLRRMGQDQAAWDRQLTELRAEAERVGARALELRRREGALYGVAAVAGPDGTAREELDAVLELRHEAEERCDAIARDVRAMEELAGTSIRRGALVKLVRGRPKWKDSGAKVEHGTVGRVVWLGESQYGPRVGVVALDGLALGPAAERADAYFTAEQNVELVPAANWAGWDRRQAEARLLSSDAAPRKGQRRTAARRDGTTFTGKVIWLGERNGATRLGLKDAAGAVEWFSVADLVEPAAAGA